MATLVDDWKRAAAEDLAQQYDRLSRAVGAGLIATEIREVIEKHCPFKDDTAYMPVPRCATCKWWEPRPDDHYANGEQTGECTSKLGPWSDCHDYTILTGNDFGCVRWTAK